MKKFKLFSLALSLIVLMAASNTFSQWTFTGFVLGAGTFPTISAYSETGVVVFGGPNGTPKVFKSTNSGVNWTDISGNLPAGKEMYTGYALDANNIFCADGGASGGAGGDAKAYRTTNGGTTWTQILNTGGTAGFFNSIVFSKTTPTFGVIQSDPPSGPGQPYFVRKTTDGGATWNVVTVPGVTGQASSQNGLCVVDANFFAFGLGNNAPARIVVTTDGGTTWNTRQSAIAGGFISGVAFADDKLRGLMGSSSSLPNVGRTTDGGVTFSTVSIGTGVTGYCNLKWVTGTNVVYVAGQTGAGGVVKRSIDGGATWTTMTTGGITNITHMEYFKSGSVATMYAVASDGSVIKYTDNLTGIDPNNTTTPETFALQQNYPNPFNPSTTIKYSVPESGNVTVKIYNTLGTEVKTVVNKNHAAGNYVENVDMSEFSSGIYFYTMTSGGFTETKKMMLVK